MEYSYIELNALPVEIRGLDDFARERHIGRNAGAGLHNRRLARGRACDGGSANISRGRNRHADCGADGDGGDLRRSVAGAADFDFVRVRSDARAGGHPAGVVRMRGSLSRLGAPDARIDHDRQDGQRGRSRSGGIWSRCTLAAAREGCDDQIAGHAAAFANGG